VQILVNWFNLGATPSPVYANAEKKVKLTSNTGPGIPVVLGPLYYRRDTHHRLFFPHFDGLLFGQVENFGRNFDAW
jgi:hypothetical protein